MQHAWSPDLVTRLVGIALAILAVVLFAASPTLLAELRGDPMQRGTSARFDFLRLATGVLACGGAAWCLVRARARDWQASAALVLFTSGMLFAGFSEVSFGQRLLGLETPEVLREINRQEEISLHNIYGIESFVYGVLPFLLFGYALLSRAAARSLAGSAASRQLSPDLLALAVVPWFAVGYFLPMAIFSAKRALVPDHVWQDQEPGELFVAFGLLCVAINAFRVLAQQKTAPARS